MYHNDDKSNHIEYTNYTRYMAKKKFGQNFLKDDEVLDKIIKSIPSDKLLCVEIGAGFGDLTSRLLEKLEVISFEIDIDLKNHLLSKFKDYINSGRLKLLFEDVLTSWTDEQSGYKDDNFFDIEYQLISNLPYNVSKRIILKALQDKQCKHILVMIQKEVALKFMARENQKDFCSLSVIAHSLCDDVNILFDVLPESFEPIPSVVSSVIYFKKSNNASIDIKFLDFLKTAFIAPRKKLFSNLAKRYSKETMIMVFDKLNIENNQRPHQISKDTYHEIYKIIME